MKTLTAVFALLVVISIQADEVNVIGSNGGEKNEGYSNTKPLGVPAKSTAGTTRVSTRGTVSTSAVTSTARPTATRTASVSRVNLRRPTGVTNTGGQSTPANITPNGG